MRPFAPLLASFASSSPSLRQLVSEEIAPLAGALSLLSAEARASLPDDLAAAVAGHLATHSGYPLLPDASMPRSVPFRSLAGIAGRMREAGVGALDYLRFSKACRRALSEAIVGSDVPADLRTNGLLAVERFLDAVECEALGKWSFPAASAEAPAAGREDGPSFAQMQKMEALGRLTGGIAHDFNNLLTGILGYASLLKSLLPEGDETAEAAAYIERAAKRASDLTRQLLAYSRKETAALLRPTDLHRIVGEAVDILSRSENKDVVIRTRLEAKSCTVEADPTGLIQLLLNLGVNAGDAMPGGGTLAISTANVRTAEGAEIEGMRVPAGEWLALRVADTGPGIPEEVREMIFEPFFTTKGEGRGTGLGLSTAYSCAKAHRGFIFLEKGSGKGASFLILLPLSPEGTERPEPAPSPSPRSIPKGSGTVLVVDDEEIPRRLACDMLRALGYRTLDAGSGARGLEILAERKDSVDLVLLDKIMPEMDGSETRRRIGLVAPGLPVVLCSGYIDDVATNPDTLKAFDAFLPKPYKMEELARTIGGAMKKNGKTAG